MPPSRKVAAGKSSNAFSSSAVNSGSGLSLRNNAMDFAMLDAVNDTIARLARERALRAVIVSGDGPSFCSGYDLQASGYEAFAVDPEHGRGSSHAIDDDLWRIEQGQRRVLSIFDLHKPVIAQVHGYCVAGGTDLALMCDLVLTSEDALIGFPPVRSMGSPPHHLWTYLLGPQWAKRMLLTGDLIDGKTAAEIGLVLKAVPAAQLDSEATALARRIAMLPHDLLAVNKGICNRALELMGRGLLQQLAAEADAVGHKSPAAAEFSRVAGEEGLRAALEWRDGKFRS